jgi:hypothetical protein
MAPVGKRERGRVTPMSTSFSCPRCQTATVWPEYCAGKEVTCPHCRNRFLARETRQESAADNPKEEVPYALPYEPPMVIPVEEEEPPPMRAKRREHRADIGGVPSQDYAQSVMDVCERRDLQQLPPPRRVVYALLVAALEKLRPHLLGSILSALIIPFFVVFAIAVGFALMGVVHLAAVALASIGIAAGHILLYLLPGFVILSAYYFKQSSKLDPITLGRNETNKVDHIKLGRLDGIFNVASPATSLFYFGVLLSSQVALLFFLPDHLGVSREGTFVECLLLTLDNLCHGVLLDTFEIYDIHLAGRVQHDWWSGTVFYFFRISYEAFLLIAGYQLWRHYSMRRLFRRLPNHWRSVDFVIEWIEHASRTEGDWAREFLDEFMFLSLAGAYLAGDDDMLRDINRRFPWLRIDEEVRRLFVDRHGERLFERAAEPE